MKLNSFTQQQQGITLVVTLIMLVLLTLFVVAAIRIANVNLFITANYQWQKEVEALADASIMRLISRGETFDGDAIQDGTDTDRKICEDGELVPIADDCAVGPAAGVGVLRVPRCTGGRIAPGYSKKLDALSPDDNDWLIRATATDPLSGSRVTIYQGMTVRQLANRCPT